MQSDEETFYGITCRMKGDGLADIFLVRFNTKDLKEAERLAKCFHGDRGLKALIKIDVNGNISKNL